MLTAIDTFPDLDTMLLALEARGYEWHRTERHLYVGADGTIAEIVQCHGGDVEVRFCKTAVALVAA